jgi:hypothetical protein
MFTSSPGAFIHTVHKGQNPTRCPFGCLFYPLYLKDASFTGEICVYLLFGFRYFYGNFGNFEVEYGEKKHRGIENLEVRIEIL